MSSGLQPLVSQVRVCGRPGRGPPRQVASGLWPLQGWREGFSTRNPTASPGGSRGRAGSRASRVAVAWPHRAGTAPTGRLSLSAGRIP